MDNFTLAGGLIGGLLIGVVSMPAVYFSKKYQIMIWCIRCLSLGVYLSLTILLWRTFYQADDPGKVVSLHVLKRWHLTLFPSPVLFVDMYLVFLLVGFVIDQEYLCTF